jgi:IS30 family transposase
MKYRPRIYYSDAQKALMWDRWPKAVIQNVVDKLYRPDVFKQSLISARDVRKY